MALDERPVFLEQNRRFAVQICQRQAVYVCKVRALLDGRLHPEIGILDLNMPAVDVSNSEAVERGRLGELLLYVLQVTLGPELDARGVQVGHALAAESRWAAAIVEKRRRRLCGLDCFGGIAVAVVAIIMCAARKDGGGEELESGRSSQPTDTIDRTYLLIPGMHLLVANPSMCSSPSMRAGPHETIKRNCRKAYRLHLLSIVLPYLLVRIGTLTESTYDS